MARLVRFGGPGADINPPRLDSNDAVHNHASAERRATRFLEMVRGSDGVGAARTLLRSVSQTSYGFEVLWEKNQLGLSVEAWVLRPEYEDLFSDEERDIARERLELHDFDVDRYLRDVARAS